MNARRAVAQMLKPWPLLSVLESTCHVVKGWQLILCRHQ